MRLCVRRHHHIRYHTNPPDTYVMYGRRLNVREASLSFYCGNKLIPVEGSSTSDECLRGAGGVPRAESRGPCAAEGSLGAFGGVGPAAFPCPLF